MARIGFSLRWLGVVIILISVFMSFLLFWFIDALSQSSEDSCTCGDSCSMVKFKIPAFFYVGVAGVILLLIIGILMLLKGKDIQGVDDSRHSWESNILKLDVEEKEIYAQIMASGGTMFQSELVEKMGWSKVKVTRTLDSLESRRYLERRRRGLTNIIVLK
jgi:hypothetical protein